MHIHKYEKIWLVAALLLIVGFIATVTYGSVGLGIALVDDGETVNPNELADHEHFGDPGVQQVGEDEYDVYIIAEAFRYTPGTVEVPEDSTVNLHVTSRDVIHSYSIVGTNVNTMAIPGEVAEMTVDFDDPEEYGVICNEYCGSNHHEMEGLFVVLPEDEFDLTELSVDAPDDVALGEDATFNISVENGMLDDHETTVTLEVGEETIEETVTIAGDDTEELSLSVPADDLGEDDHSWTVSVDDESENGTLTVVSDDDEDGGDN